MTTTLPQLSGCRYERANLLPSWCTVTALFRLGEEDVFGHRLSATGESADAPDWAKNQSLVKLHFKQPKHVLCVRGWLSYEGSAWLITDVPRTAITTALNQLTTLQRDALAPVVISTVSNALEQLHELGIFVGPFSREDVFVSESDEAFLDPLPAILRSTGIDVPENPRSWVAPECLGSDLAPSEGTDLYSLGLLAWWILHYPKDLPWHGNPRSKTERCQLSVDPTRACCSAVIPLVAACTDPNPRRRNLHGVAAALQSGENSYRNPDRRLSRVEVDVRQVVGNSNHTVVKGLWDGLEVAVKVIQRSPSERLEDLDREIVLSTSFAHPHIAEVYGWTTNPQGTAVWLVMRYYRKGNLSTMLRSCAQAQQPLTEAKFVSIAIGLARALVYLSDRRAVHRDIKPQNILVADDDRVVLADFGFAKRLDLGESKVTSVSGGSKPYAAPEVCEKGPDLTPAADVYSFGCVLKEMQSHLRPGDSFREAVQSLVDRCRQRMSGDRPTAVEVVGELKALEPR